MSKTKLVQSITENKDKYLKCSNLSKSFKEYYYHVYHMAIAIFRHEAWG